VSNPPLALGVFATLAVVSLVLVVMLMRGRGTVTALDRQLRAMMEERDQLRRELLEQEHAARLRQQQADQLAARLEELRNRNGVLEADIEQWRQQLHEARLALRG